MEQHSDGVVPRAYRVWLTPSPPPPSIAEFRRGYRALFARFPAPGGVREEQRVAGGVRTLVITAGDDRAGAGRSVIYCHGGGFVCGHPEAVRPLGAHLARAVAAEVVLPDYRLAPEHPYPAAVHDVLAVYRALLVAGRPPATIAVAGESAGAGLALAAIVAARAARLPLPAAAVCFSPWVDLTLTATSIRTNSATDTVVDGDVLTRFAAAYLNGRDPTEPTASPILADLAGFPPLHIQVGAGERLLDDALGLARRAEAAGVPVTLDVLPDAPHALQLFTPEITEARQAVDRAARFIAATLREPAHGDTSR